MVHLRTAHVVYLRGRALLCREASHALKHVHVFLGADSAVRRKIVDTLSRILPRDRKKEEQVRYQSQAPFQYLNISGNRGGSLDFILMKCAFGIVGCMSITFHDILNRHHHQNTQLLELNALSRPDSIRFPDPQASIIVFDTRN